MPILFTFLAFLILYFGVHNFGNKFPVYFVYMGNTSSISVNSENVFADLTRSIQSTETQSATDLSTNIDDGDYIEDIDEDELIIIIHNIVNKDEVLRAILNLYSRPLPKKSKLTRTVKRRKSTAELWDTIWGKSILNIRAEISQHGDNPHSDLQRDFRYGFRVPYSLFVDIVRELYRS